MEDLVQFVVENQDFVWYLLAFFVFIYFLKFFLKLLNALLLGWKKNKIYKI